MRKYFILLTLALYILAATGCAKTPPGDKTPTGRSAADTKWMTARLMDVKTGKTFQLSDFKGKPVLLETFAVWCPTCRQQQDQIKRLHEKLGDDVISVSIDTDPNEDKAKVIEHMERYGYEWRFALDADNFGRELVGEFGVNVVNAPSAPIVLISADQQARLLRFGVKSADELEKEIAEDG